MTDWKKTVLTCTVCVISFLISACAMVGPDFETPEAPIADAYLQREDDAISGAPADTEDWWEVFEDPILDHLVRMAYDQNLSLRIAGLRVLEARAQLGIAAGSLYPQQQEINAEAAWATQEGPGAFSAYSAGFDVAWELDFWGKFRRGIQSANANLLASIAGYDDVLVTLTAEVARSYILIRTLEERIHIAQQNVELQKRSLQMVEARFKFGAVTELDVQQAKTLLHSTEALVPQLLLSLNQTRHALAILLGLPPEDLSHILGDSGSLPTIPAQVAVGMPAELLRRRPDIRRAELQAAAQGARIGIARGEMLPSFSLFGTLGWSGTNAANASLADPAFSAAAGPAFKWPIFNYGRLRNRVRVGDARFEQAMTGYQNSVLNAAREVEDAMTGFFRSAQEADALKNSVDAAKRSTEISMLQYKEGLADYTRVLDSTRSLAAQWDRYTQTRGDIAINLIGLYKALGGGWELSRGKDFVPIDVREKMEQRTNWGNLLEISNGDQLPTVPENGFWRKPSW